MMMMMIHGKHEIKELQKTAVLGTAHILRKVLVQKYKRFNIANSVVCAINSDCRIAATLYCVETWFVLVYIIVNIMHKGNNDDDNNNNNNNNNRVQFLQFLNISSNQRRVFTVVASYHLILIHTFTLLFLH